MTEEKASIAAGVKHTAHDESLDALKKAPVIGKGYTTITDNFKKFSEAKDGGDVANASAQLVTDGASFVASAGADMASFVLDPVGWLVSNGLNMLLELVEPLEDALHFVTGDGPSLKNAAGNFTEIGKGFVTLAEDFVKTGDEALKDWEGGGGDAARKALADFATGIQGIGSSAGAVAETLQMWSMAMTVIEEVIKAIISELVTWMIYIWLPALAASVVSLGSSVAAAMTASIAKAASALSKITKHMGKLGKLLDKFMNFMIKWTDDLVKQGAKLTKAGKVGMLPGQEKAIVGAFAKGTGTRLGTTGDVLLETAKGVPNQVLKSVTGVNPADVAKGSAYGGKAVVDLAAKAVDYGEDFDKMDENSQRGGGQSVEDSRQNLDMDR
ncbi:hypothetical protein [Amycolatopsis suaedae]|uniref:WXG100 family type VII secretion target n=1 Tax=Amycolatopsis suaedae TaxID=2510978 RepID=A0A4V2EM83_9PSEU|nr:hypothetical protein [Amycolatopsis suaedae]RZQ64165.1 hypothetical protein EWH70_09220 [Amycolatopsis suaedae]